MINREATQYWDLLLAQSPWSADVLRGAFAYNGEILDQGYPRNDVLAPENDSQDRRLQVRKHLGIGDQQRVVLYAPTWRDNLKDSSGHYSRVDFLDIPRSVAKLGPKYTVLFRSHSNGIHGKAKRMPRGAKDVTLYPSINDLIIASDALVTDYSSIMFDYVVTGRPIIFIAPDIETYAGNTRGFYFDFQNRAPGPVVRTAEGAIDAIKMALRDPRQKSDKYWQFLADFAPADDGYAGQRAAARILEMLD